MPPADALSIIRAAPGPVSKSPFSVMKLMQYAFHRKTRLGTAVVVWPFSCLLILLVISSSPAQGPGRELAKEIPWREDRGAGRLTSPGPSRVLPTPGDREPEAQLVSGEADAGLRVANRPPQDGAADDAQAERWWNEDAARSIGNAGRAEPGRGLSPRGEILLSTQILSWVGNEPILAGDLLGRINEALEPAVGKVPEEELERQRWMLMEQLLPAAIESKLVYLDFTRNLEREQIEGIRTGVYKQFDEKQLPQLVEQAKLKNAAELEMRMRSYGSSLENVRRTFYEQVAAREMIRRQAGEDAEVTHDDLLAYYREHLDEYSFESKARWEHLMTRFNRFPSRREAYNALREMGNSVLYGAKLETVARERSQGPTAASGGQYDWTTQGSLVSRVLDEAIFSIKVGELSEILMDDDGFHIVRVIERQEAGHMPFVEAQVGIRDKIRQQRRDEKVQAYLEKLKRETYVWNYFSEGEQVAGQDRSLK